MLALAPGDLVAGYRIESIIGRGGMGIVYRAVELGLDRVVALKAIVPELLDEPGVRERFLREARAAASIEHPNVIPVHAAGERDGIPYLVMRFVDGSDLRTLVRRDGLPDPARAASVITDVAEALDAIHRAGYVHRDVKPANILVDRDDHVYLSDFGLTKHMLTRGGATATGQWVGTLDYVAPEQIRAGPVDARTDVYALGGVLAFLLTGRVPFDRDTDEAKLWAQLSEPPPVPSAVRPGLPQALDPVVERAMAKAPADRYPSAGDLARALRAGVSGGPLSQPERMVARGGAAPADRLTEIGPDASTVTAPTTQAPRRRRRALLVAAPVLLVAAVLVGVLLSREDEPGLESASAPKPPTKLTVPAGHRPNGVALAGGSAWVTSNDRPDVERFDVVTGGRVGATRVGLGAASIVADADADGTGVWVAVKRTREVVRIDAKGKITNHLRPRATPTRVVVGFGSVWVAVSATDGTDALVRFDRDGDVRSRTPVAHDIVGLTTGQDHVWIAEADVHNVLRLDPSNDKVEPWVTLSDTITDLSDGAGYVWATLPESDSVVRVTPQKRNSKLLTAVGHRPLRAVVAGGRLYVTVFSDHVVAIMDPANPKPPRQSYAGPANPDAITADAQSLWVTGVGDDTLTRQPYR